MIARVKFLNLSYIELYLDFNEVGPKGIKLLAKA